MTLKNVHDGSPAYSDVFKHLEVNRSENIILMLPASSIELDTQHSLTRMKPNQR